MFIEQPQPTTASHHLQEQQDHEPQWQHAQSLVKLGLALLAGAQGGSLGAARGRSPVGEMSDWLQFAPSLSTVPAIGQARS